MYVTEHIHINSYYIVIIYIIISCECVCSFTHHTENLSCYSVVLACT